MATPSRNREHLTLETAFNRLKKTMPAHQPMSIKCLANSLVLLRARTVVTFLVCCTGFGCSNLKNLPSEFSFTTHINESGLKLFQLSYPAPKRVITLYTGNPGAAPRRESTPYSDDYLQKILALAVDQSEYCREGYLQLGRYAGETSERLRGECKEKATTEDLEHFPNTLNRW